MLTFQEVETLDRREESLLCVADFLASLEDNEEGAPSASTSSSPPPPDLSLWDDLSLEATEALLFWVEKKIKSKISDVDFTSMLQWLGMYPAWCGVIFNSS
ncbi:MAG: hypothetical protein LW878_07345 [Proteobacteria bacterium]|nr:hypothetical protein [Pseudomonadota bacterium]